MTKIFRIIIILLIFSPFATIGQAFEEFDRCNTVEFNKQLERGNSQRASTENFEKWINNRVRQLRNEPTNQITNPENQRYGIQTYTIPVIFHIIHNGEAIGDTPNLNSLYIDAQIEQLNLDFANLSGSTYAQAADIQIQFCAAKIDPNGACLAEPGINRINRNSLGLNPPPYTNTYYNTSIQPLTQWNPNDYCNIWVSELQSFLGVAQFPEAGYLEGIHNNNGSAITDGCIMHYNTIGSVATPFPSGNSFNLGRTLTHELGHFFGLRHISGDGDCGVDDFCSDTPAQANQSAGCPVGNDSCTSPGQDMVENYMDYSFDSCMNTFTANQRDRMLVVMDPTLGSIRRASLNDSPACGCAPIADFSPIASTLNICDSFQTIEFINESIRTYANTSFQWSFSGAGVSTNSSTLENPTITINGSGPLTVSLTVTNANDTDTFGPVNYQVNQIQNAPVATTLISPQDGFSQQDLATNLSWNSVAIANAYLVEVATDLAFSSIVFSEITNNTNLTTTSLNPITAYYWRVISINDCNDANPHNGNSSPIWSYTTANTTCTVFGSVDTPVTIPSSGTPSVQSIITVPAGLGTIADFRISKLAITHSYVQDLQVVVTAPNGTSIRLINEICGSQNNVDLMFHDSGSANATIPCPPIDGNTYQADALFSFLNGTDPTGDWTLSVVDNATGDGGQIDMWELEICIQDQITCPGNLSLSATAMNVSCFSGADGSISANASGGATPYQYLWEDNAGNQLGTLPLLASLSVGTYSCTVTDNNGCQQSIVEVISEPSLLTNTEVLTNVSCFGGNDGEINVTVSGGTTPYSYNWSNGLTSQQLVNLTAGVYDLTITDANNCTHFQSYLLSEASQVIITDNITDVNCFGDATGDITLSISGGTGPYTYSWSSGETSSNITAKAAGNYTVTVTDANNCQTTQSYTIVQPAQALTMQQAYHLNVTCFGDNNGEIAVSVTGGKSPYTYQWSNATSVDLISGLVAGIYSVTVTDAQSCQITNSWEITEPADLQHNVVSSVDISCFGETDGNATIGISGGSGPYTINWSTGESGFTANQLISGFNSFTVTDDQGCMLIDSIEINEPSALTIDLVSTTNATCLTNSDGVLHISGMGGTAPYAYSWSNNATSNQLSNLAVGEYFVTITDDRNCTYSTVFAIDPPAFSANPSIQEPTCNGNNDGSITLNATGDGSPFTYMWYDGSTLNSVNNLAVGSYAVTITDSNNCSFLESIDVDNPIGITVVASSSDISCANTSNGSVNATAVGGVGPYTYDWEDTQGNSLTSFTGLLAGDYFVTATDANGCTGMSMVTINPPVTEYTMANNNQLIGPQIGSADFEVDGKIESDQIISGNTVSVDYDSGISVELKAGFEVVENSSFHAFIDGCGGAQ